VKIILNIDRGKGSDEENLAIFHQLEEHKTEIENAFGGKLEWLEKPENRACQIKRGCSKKGLDAPEKEGLPLSILRPAKWCGLRMLLSTGSAFLG